MEPRNEYFSLLSLNSLNNKEESEFTSLDSLKSFKEDYRVFFSFSLNSLKNKEKFRVFFLGLVKYSRRKKNGKEFRSASLFAWQLSVFWVAFEHTQNESSDLSSFLGFGWPWENLPRSLSVGPPPIGYSSSHMESSWMPPAFRTLLCQSCLVTNVSCFVQRMLACVGLLSVSFLIYPGHP